MKKIRTAIIGQGRSGRDIHGKYFKSEDNIYYDVVYAVELDPERRERAEKEYPNCKALSDYKELFDKTDVDLVINASYSDMHYPITRDLLLHGFNVIEEKPMGRCRYECEELIKISKEKNVKFGVFQQSLYSPFFVNAKKIADSGILGKIQQVRITYNGFNRRWDWQTLQSRLAGCVYNTGPHPIGYALAFLDFDDNARLEFSSIANVASSGDAEDYAKLIITAPGKPVIDVEINPIDAYSKETIRICGTLGSLRTTTTEYEMTYRVEGENPERPLIAEPLKNEEGYPTYCEETLNLHTVAEKVPGELFAAASKSYYEMFYKALTENAPVEVKPEYAAKVISIIEEVHAKHPMPVLY